MALSVVAHGSIAPLREAGGAGAEIDSRLILVVHVSDDHGSPVGGLTESNFKVFFMGRVLVGTPAPFSLTYLDPTTSKMAGGWYHLSFDSFFEGLQHGTFVFNIEVSRSAPAGGVEPAGELEEGWALAWAVR
jgi:hypothetical protein